MLDELRTYEFLESVGLVTLAASLVTMVLTSIIKFILTKTKVLKENTDAVKKDVILSRTGRITGLISYSVFYVLNMIYIEKTQLVIDVKLITSLLSGGTLTLVISKGIYTMIRQMEKKNSVYEKLEIAESTISELEKEVSEVRGISQIDNKEISKQKDNVIIKENRKTERKNNSDNLSLVDLFGQETR